MRTQQGAPDARGTDRRRLQDRDGNRRTARARDRGVGPLEGAHGTRRRWVPTTRPRPPHHSSKRSASPPTAGRGCSTSRSPTSAFPRDHRRGPQLIQHDVAGVTVDEGRHAGRHLASWSRRLARPRRSDASGRRDRRRRASAAVPGVRSSRVPSERRTSTRVSAMISHTASAPTTVSRGGTDALAAKLLSMLTVTRPSTPSVAVMPSSAVHRCSSPCSSTRSATSIRALGLDASHLAEAPPDRVDRVRAPRADPAPAAIAVEQPAVAPHRHPRAGRQVRPLHVLDRTERVGAHELAQQPAHGMEPELEVAERDRARVGRFPNERGRFVGVQRERLVAQHRLARRRATIRTCAACRNGGECTLTRSTSGRAETRAISASSRGETTSTTSQPSVASNAGATTRAPKPVPMTATFTRPSPPAPRRRPRDGIGATRRA